jgi:uncharacterized protein (DUF4415 family)
MRKNYDFSNSIKNPYAKRLKSQVTIRLDNDIVEYFKKLAGESGIAYQVLINLFLKECADEKRKLSVKWKKKAA